MYEFPRLEVTSAQERVCAQIIGNSSLAKKIQSLLKNQEIITDLAHSPETVNLSRRPNFVYWFLIQNFRQPPQILVNFLKSSQAKLIIISGEPMTNEHNELITDFLDAGIDACQSFVKDVYGPSVEDSDLSLIWRDIKTKFVVNLPGDDAAVVYPIYVDDAAAAIIKISFSTQTYGKTFYITGSDKTTILSFSYRLREEIIRQTQKLPPINYTQANFSPPFTVHRSLFTVHDAAATRDFLNWRPETDLSQGLAKLVMYCFPPSNPSVPSLSSLPEPAQSSRRTKGNFLKKKTIQHFRRAFVIPAVLATAFFAATLSLPRLLDYLAASLAKTSPDRLARFEPIFTLFGRRQQFARLETAAALNLKQTEISLASGQLLQSITSESSVSPPEILDLLDSQVTSLLKSLPPGLPAGEAGENRRILSLARELIPAVRSILTSPQKQTFLVVFQNSAEIRPTGGFISSMAFVTLQKGKLLDIDYQSVYQLDSQLVGVEAPPEPVKNYLGETNWLVRDANWSADANQSARKLKSLVQRATGRNLDGVVFLTTPALRQILTQTGDLTAPDTTVWNRLNVVERLVYNDRVDPQTGARNDPFISLAKTLEEFIKTNPRRRQALIGALNAIDHQDLLVSWTSLPDSAFGAGVAPSFPPCPFLPADQRPMSPVRRDEWQAQAGDPFCLSDHLQIVDANLGANKADHFVIKEHDLTVSLSDQNQIVSALTLRYRNPAGSSQYPAGTYRNYVRVYLPNDAVITSVVRLSPEGLVAVPTDNSIESGNKVVGFFMEIPVGGQEIFLLESVRPQKLVLQNQTAAYSLVISKQPGTAIPTSVSIGYPPSLAPLAVSDQVTAVADKLLLNHSGETNLTLTVEFAATE